MMIEKEVFKHIGSNWSNSGIDCVIEAYCQLYMETGHVDHMIIADALMQGKALVVMDEIKCTKES
jgi:hypothetical protein